MRCMRPFKFLLQRSLMSNISLTQSTVVFTDLRTGIKLEWWWCLFTEQPSRATRVTTTPTKDHVFYLHRHEYTLMNKCILLRLTGTFPVRVTWVLEPDLYRSLVFVSQQHSLTHSHPGSVSSQSAWCSHYECGSEKSILKMQNAANGFQSAFSATQNPLKKLISQVISVETHQGFLQNPR